MSKFVVRHPRLIIASVILLTILFGVELRRGIVLDVSPLGFVARGSRSRADFAEARKHFGPDDYLVIAVVAGDVFSLENLAKLRELHGKVERTGGIIEVLSLVNVPYARSVNGVVEIDKLIPPLESGDDRLAQARAIATSDRLYAGNLVSSDGRTAALNILLDPELPTHKRHEITRDVYELTRNAGFEKVYFAGDPFSQWRCTEAIKSDLRLFLPLTLALIALLLWLCFRSLAAVVLPLATIAIGLIWLMGVMALLQAHFTVLALMLPTLMLAIGCSYMIHVINQVGIVEERAGERGSGRVGERESGRVGERESGRAGEWESGRARELAESFSSPPLPLSPSLALSSCIEEAMRFITLPVVVSALTIIAGFLSLAFTKIPAIRTTAIFAAIGAGVTMILSLTFIPAALVLLPRRAIAFRVGLAGKMCRLLEETGRWATSHQTPLYVLTAIIIIVSLVGMKRINIDIDYFHFFKPGSETSVGLAQINRRLSGAVSFEIIVEGQRPGAMEDPRRLERIAELQSFAEQQRGTDGQGIDRTISVVDFVKHLNRAFHDNDPQHYAIPADQKVVEELLSDRGQLRGFLSQDGRTARILIRSNLTGSHAMATVIEEIEKRGRALLPDCRVLATGTFVLLNRTSDQIAGEQVQSVTIALITIYIVLSILFGSLRVGLTAIVPNLIPVLFFFGFMGWRGIPLNLTTSLVASVVLGLAVDNSVQFIVRFCRVQAESATLRDAIIQSMRLSGRPIIYANVALAVAFAIFALSNFEPIATFGLLSAVTIIGCLVEDLVLLPARLTSPIFRAVRKNRAARETLLVESFNKDHDRE
jgi:predicted RND superfamily exporter protein